MIRAMIFIAFIMLLVTIILVTIGASIIEEHERKFKDKGEWLSMTKETEYLDFIYEELASLFGSPCDYSPIDEFMAMNKECQENCGSKEKTDVKCWKRYFKTQYIALTNSNTTQVSN